MYMPDYYISIFDGFSGHWLTCYGYFWKGSLCQRMFFQEIREFYQVYFIDEIFMIEIRSGFHKLHRLMQNPNLEKISTMDLSDVKSEARFTMHFNVCWL